MGFGRGFIQFCVNPTAIKRDPAGYEDTRASLIGNSFHAGVVALLLAPLLREYDLINCVPSPDAITARFGLAPGEVYQAGVDCSLTTAKRPHRFDGRRRDKVARSADEASQLIDPRSNNELVTRLFYATLRASDYRGSDVRLDTGELLRPHSWPRRSLDSARYVWYSVMAAKFEREEHINVLELKAYLLHLRWRTRTSKRLGSRFLHLLDSQVCLGVLAKGRSSSWRLNRVLNRTNALTLACRLYPLNAYVMSEWNTSDVPSRTWEKKRSPTAKSFPKRKGTKQVIRSRAKRRNQVFPRKFDSTKGYPGEGPRVRKARAKRTPIRKILEGKFLAYRTQAERRKARRDVDLRWATLAPKTVALYREAFANLWRWVGVLPPRVIRDPVAYDMLIADFIMYAWQSGLTRAHAGNALSASIKVYPEVRGRLAESWYLLNAWTKLEVSCRAGPLPPELCIGMIHICLEDNDIATAFLLALGFECFLRPGEILGLRWGDIDVPQASSPGIIRLVDTKTSRRTGAPEVLTFRDPLTIALYLALELRRSRQDSPLLPIFAGTEADFRAKFKRLVAMQGAGTWGLRPHSIRRGGATAYFRATGSMSRTVERGRWATTRVARLYICDGLATSLDNRMCPEMKARLKRESSQVAVFCRSIRALHRRWRSSTV